MKKTKSIIAATAIVLFAGILFMMNGCAVTQAIADKDGATLWSENCMRCHNTPTPTDFSDTQWEVIGTHMKLRANLTDDEVKKVIEFLQLSN